MAEAAAGSERTHTASQSRVARARQWLRRAASANSHERNTLTLIGKSTLAAAVSWAIAHDVMAAQSPAFAPFSAVLIMQVTVYQSLLQALRFLGAVAAGVALQGALGMLAGPTLLAFVLVTLAAMTIGRWRRLGSQGSQVATAAFFAFSTYVAASGNSERLTQLGQILLLVLIGCGTGVVVNVLVFPPMRYRNAEYGVRTLAHSLCDLLSDVYPALREGEVDAESTGHWRQRARHLGPIVGQAQASVHTAWESMFYNPRRMLPRRGRSVSFARYQSVVDALERVTHQVTSLLRSLDQQQDPEELQGHRDFLHGYGDFLAALAPVTEVIGRIDEDRLADQADELCAAAERAQDCRLRLAENAEESGLPLADPSRPYGVLLVEAARLMDEFQYTCDVLRHAASTGSGPGSGSGDEGR